MSTGISRRKLLQLAVAGAASSALAACTKVVKETVLVEQTVPVVQTVVVPEVITQVVEKEVTTVVEKEVTKIVQNVGPTNMQGVTLPADALGLDQQFVLQQVPTGGYGNLMQSMFKGQMFCNLGTEPLLTVNNDLDVVGIACSTYKMAQDDKGWYWEFALRPELTWSDGKPLTAQDWVWTLQHSLSTQYDYAWMYMSIINAQDVVDGKAKPEDLGIVAVDDFTLRIYSKDPAPDLPGLLTMFYPMPKWAFEARGEDWSTKPDTYVSSGPWKWTEWNPGVSAKWELREDYKGVRKAMFTQCIFETLPTGLPAYMAGDIQSYVWGADTPLAERTMILTNPVLSSESHPWPSVYSTWVQFNSLGTFPPLDNKDVRYALCKSVPKDELVATVYKGFAYTGWGALPKGFPNYNGEVLSKLDINIYDPEAARQLLSKAGYPDGKGFPVLDFNIPQSGAEIYVAIAESWKKELGIEVTLTPRDYGTYAAMRATQLPISHSGWYADYYDPSNFLGSFLAGGSRPVNDAAWDAFYKEANATADPVKRMELLKQAEIKLAEGGSFLWLANHFSYCLYPCNIAGPRSQTTKQGYRFFNRPMGPTAWEGLYWANSNCRQGINS